MSADPAALPTLAANADHVAHCFASIISALEGKPSPRPAFDTSPCPFFVTLDKQGPRGQYDLRGCIGTLSPRPLTDLGPWALKSAFKDSRFPPLEASEVPLLEVKVSLLVDYETADNAYDWEVGKHGIIIEFSVGRKSYSATYLPEVAGDRGWSQQHTIEQLARKAGFTGRLSPEVLATMHTTRYQSSKFAMTYQQYLEYFASKA